MDLYDEFFAFVGYLNKLGARYAVVGGIALAFHGRPRFTRDIDLLLHPDDLGLAKMAFERLGYTETAEPWTFRENHLTLRRFLKICGEDEMMIDILLANTADHQKMIEDAIETPSETGMVRVASRQSLIDLKRVRNSNQDKADIEALEHDTD